MHPEEEEGNALFVSKHVKTLFVRVQGDIAVTSLLLIYMLPPYL